MGFGASCRELRASSLRSPDKSIVIPTGVEGSRDDIFKPSQRDPSVPIAGLGVTVFALHLIQKTHFYLRNVCLDCQGLR
jgi:hypothetical protein